MAMILPIFIVSLMVGGVLAWMVAGRNPIWARWISLLTVTINFLLTIVLWIQQPESHPSQSSWLADYSLPWIPQFGIVFHLALDGLSLLMLLLTFFLGIISVLISWKEIEERVGAYHFCVLWVLAGVTGVFLAMDFFLFFFFWEVMLIPMFFLIVIWGHENSRYAAFKFFIFTQASGLLMLVAILGLYFINGNQTGNYTFDYFQLLNANLAPDTARWLMLGFLAAFLVKLPAVPFHSWLPDAHSQAPTAGSLILAGLLLKTGAYGLLRFIVPLFREEAISMAPWLMAMGVFGIIYGAILAFAQTDLKRLVAYTSVSHMGFILLGVFSFNEIAAQGVVMQMITHGISTGALFVLAGFIYERLHTRDITRMGGLWKSMPFLGTCGLIFSMASLGLPGLGNFVAEFLTLVGSWQATHKLTIVATIGLVAATIYSLRIMQKIFYGMQAPTTVLADLSIRERLIMITLVVSILWLGLFPQWVLNTSQPSVKVIIEGFDRSEANARKLANPHSLVSDKKGGSYE